MKKSQMVQKDTVTCDHCEQVVTEYVEVIGGISDDQGRPIVENDMDYCGHGTERHFCKSCLISMLQAE